MIIRSKAPFRLGLAGGGTDVSPYSDLYGGAILNVTVNLYARTTIIPRTDSKIIIHSIDQAKIFEFESAPELKRNGEIDLQLGVYNRIVKDFVNKPLGFEMTTSMDVPTGSGLGTSSTLVVSIIGAFVEWLELPLGEYDIAKLAYDIERVDLGMAGGKQDQYAATFGGVNFMEFLENDKVIVNPLRTKKSFLNEVNFDLILYYTNTNRESAKIIEKQIENVKASNTKPVEAMHQVKQQAFQMKEAFLRSDVPAIGRLLHESWLSKKEMASGISNDNLDQIYETALAAGATGGKISGAGGGGFMLFFAEKNNRYAVITALKKLGGNVVNYEFTQKRPGRMDNPIKEAIVLAGGLGTRLRSEIGEFPKTLAPVNGEPFLHYLLRYLKKNGIEKVILSVGFKHELVMEAIGNSFEGMEIVYAIEKEPLGTGGAIKLALEKTKTDPLFVCNGDTFFDIDLQGLYAFHVAQKSNCTIALKDLENVDRYGSVEIDETGKVLAFREKQFREKTTINGGIYCINHGMLIHYPVNTPFSLETNYLENNPKAKKIYGKRFEGYFKDIGVPEDYHQFEKDVLK